MTPVGDMLNIAGYVMSICPWSDPIRLNGIIRIAVEIILTGWNLRIRLRPIGAYAPEGVIYVCGWWWCLGPFGWGSNF